MNDLTKLGKLGLVGVMLGLIGLVAFSMSMIYKISSSHIEKSADSNKELTVVIQNNTEVMRQVKSSLEDSMSKFSISIDKNTAAIGDLRRDFSFR